MCNKLRNHSIVREISNGELFEMRQDGEMIALTPVKKNWVDDEPAYEAIDGAESKEVPSGTFDLFFAVEKYAEPEVPAEEAFQVKGGKLYMDGVQVETGTLVIEKFLTAIPGKAMFLVKGRKGEKHDVKVYDIEADDFYPLYNAQGAEAVELVYSDPANSVTALAVTFTGKVLVPSKEQGADPEEVIEETRYLVVYSGLREVSDDYNIHGAATTPAVFTTEQGSAKTVRLVFTGTDAYKRVFDTDGESHYVRDPENDKVSTTAHVAEIEIEDGAVGTKFQSVYFNGLITKILPAPQGDFVFVTEKPDGIVHTFFDGPDGKRIAIGEKVVEAVEDHPTPLAITYKGLSDTTFIFGNDRYEAVKIHVVRTKGKGFVTTFE